MQNFGDVKPGSVVPLRGSFPTWDGDLALHDFDDDFELGVSKDGSLTPITTGITLHGAWNGFTGVNDYDLDVSASASYLPASVHGSRYKVYIISGEVDGRDWAGVPVGFFTSGMLMTEAELEQMLDNLSGQDTRDMDEVNHVWDIQRNGNGAWISTPETTLYLTPGDEGVADFRAGFNCNIPSICPNGTVLSSMEDDPAVDSVQITVAKLGIGPNGLKHPIVAKVELDVIANATPGTYYVTSAVSNRLGAGPMPVYGKVVLLEAP